MKLLNSKINIINKFNYHKDNLTLGSNKFYKYELKNIKSSYSFSLKMKTATIFVLNAKNSFLVIKNKKIRIKRNNIIYLENINKIQINNKSRFLLVSKKNNRKKKDYFKILNTNNIYTVRKPWGHEKWINGYKSIFAFKEIVIKRGKRTSLQYHKKKIESNFLIKGKTTLVYKKNQKENFSKIKTNDLSKKTILSPSVINVSPFGIHRLIANTNIKLLEVSSPHLDDVIRIQDDQKRTDGKIKSEHHN